MEREKSITDQIKSNRLFILGAGFSAGAGVPLTNRLLPLAMEKLRKEYPEFFLRVDGYAHECASLLDDEIPLDYGGNDFFQELCTFLEYVELSEYAGGNGGPITGREKSWPCATSLPRRWQSTPRKETTSRSYTSASRNNCMPGISSSPSIGTGCWKMPLTKSGSPIPTIFPVRLR